VLIEVAWVLCGGTARLWPDLAGLAKDAYRPRELKLPQSALDHLCYYEITINRGTTFKLTGYANKLTGYAKMKANLGV
jgi:hypothetical protein